MTDYTNAIEIRDLCKQYDGFRLDKVSFTVPKGSIMGFIGQNGAGKTTTIRALLGIIPPDSGELRLLGHDAIKDEIAVKERMAAVFDEMPFQDIFHAQHIERILAGIFPHWEHETYQNYLDRFQLPQKKKIGSFSKGMKMKLQIAAALSHGAELLVMDEATTGLDPVVRNEILGIFLEYLQDENHSILMSSHITSDLEKIADSVTFIDRGRILLSGCKDEILERHAVIRCTRHDYKDIDPADFISARVNDFGAELMVSGQAELRRKYDGLAFDPATLEEIMVYYVNREKKEWFS